jgi:hypothetical protein
LIIFKRIPFPIGAAAIIKILEYSSNIRAAAGSQENLKHLKLIAADHYLTPQNPFLKGAAYLIIFPRIPF